MIITKILSAINLTEMRKIILSLLVMGSTILHSQNKDLEAKEFESSMSQMTVSAMDTFILLHPESELKDKAVQYRDSLALPQEGASYYRFSEYVERYPNSRFSASIIEKLPDMVDRDLHFQDSFHSTIELLKHFVTLYPTAPNIKKVKIDLELYYARSLSYKFNIEEYKDFRKLFPESRYYYNNKTKKMAKKYDPKESPAATY